MIGKIRPQALTAIVCATVFSMFAAYLGYKMGATEILTAIVGGVFGFLGGVSLRIIENDFHHLAVDMANTRGQLKILLIIVGVIAAATIGEFAAIVIQGVVR